MYRYDFPTIIILHNNEFNPEKTLNSSTNGTDPFFQRKTEQKPDKLVRE